MATRNVIVLPTDFSKRSEAALAWARRLADQMQADIHCIYVVQEPQVYSNLDMPMPMPAIGDLKQSAEKRMTRFAREHRETLGKVSTHVLVGRPAEEVVNYAKEHDAALIVMTTHGYSGMKHVLLGSTTEAVLRHAHCPVLSIRNL